MCESPLRMSQGLFPRAGLVRCWRCRADEPERQAEAEPEQEAQPEASEPDANPEAAADTGPGLSLNLSLAWSRYTSSRTSTK
jgi:hypothetical protein